MRVIFNENENLKRKDRLISKSWYETVRSEGPTAFDIYPKVPVYHPREDGGSSNLDLVMSFRE